MSQEIFVARQAIFDTHQQVYAYELLFRSGRENFYSHNNADDASTRVIDTSVHGFSWTALTAGKKAFINVTRNVLVDGSVGLLPSDVSVVEVLETVEPDEEVLEALRALKQSGFLVALDDFVAKPGLEPLVALADIIKVDFLVTVGDERKRMIDRFGSRGIRMLAEKVENWAEFNDARTAGYTYFQGYFFCKPEMVVGKGISPMKLGYLRFLAECQRPDLSLDGLEQVIRQDVALSMKLLRYLNSAAFGWRMQVTSIKDALIRLGERPLRKWASLVACTCMGQDKTPELVMTSLIRARFCELLGPPAKLPGQDLDLFLIGMLSAVDALVDRPLPEILSEMAVDDAVKATLLGGEGKLSKVYALVLAYEKGEWERIGALEKELALPEGTIPMVYRTALKWAEQIFLA